MANTFHHERSIAKYVVASAVMLRRSFLIQDRKLRDNVWATSVYDSAISQYPTLGDAHVGFVGLGHIGLRSWNLLRAFGCTAAAVTGSGGVSSDVGLRWAGDTGELDRLMHECDVVVLMTPHSSGITSDTFVGRLDDVAANISRLQRGEPLRNLVPR